MSGPTQTSTPGRRRGLAAAAVTLAVVAGLALLRLLISAPEAGEPLETLLIIVLVVAVMGAALLGALALVPRREAGTRRRAS